MTERVWNHLSMAEIPTGIIDRVRDGARLLDEQRPGWWQRIDILKLEMNNCSKCILGQLFGHYDSGLTRLFGSPDEAEEASERGFDHDEEFGAFTTDGQSAYKDRVNNQYSQLARVWIDEVLKRASD